MNGTERANWLEGRWTRNVIGMRRTFERRPCRDAGEPGKRVKSNRWWLLHQHTLDALASRGPWYWKHALRARRAVREIIAARADA